MPKQPIWLDDTEMEILRGFLGEILDDKDTPDYAIEPLHNIYKQTLEDTDGN